MSNLTQFQKSILNNGGASYNLNNGEVNPSEGFMVSIAGHEQTFAENWQDNLQQTIATYIKEKAAIVGNKANNQPYFIGAWVDGGKLYLDVSVKVSTKKVAERIAKENNQLAYYDNKKEISIYLPTSKK